MAYLSNLSLHHPCKHHLHLLLQHLHSLSAEASYYATTSLLISNKVCLTELLM